MASWQNIKHEPSSINGGNQYEEKDRVSKEQLNAITENAFYAVEKADEALEKANSSFESNGTVISVGGLQVTTIDFDSDPQTQINGKANKDLSNLTVNALKYDEVYNMNSNDSNINWGYTSGIQGSVTVSGKNFTKYKKLIISVNCAYSSFSYIISLENVNTLIPSDLAGYSYSGSAQSQGANVNNQVGISTAFISTDKTKIYHQSIGRYYIASTNAYVESDNSNVYCITNIMGVY